MELERISIGSVNMKDPIKAVKFVADNFDIIALPECPSLDGYITDYPSKNELAATQEFKNFINSSGKNVAKVQVVGPYTYNTLTKTYNLTSINLLVNYLLRNIESLNVNKLYIGLDEPCVNKYSNNNYAGLANLVYKKVRDNISKNIELVNFYHCCGDLSGKLNSLSSFVNMISFDAVYYNIFKDNLREDYENARNNGLKICWGVVSAEMGDYFKIRDLKIASDNNLDIREGDMISISCGLGNLSEPYHNKSVELLKEKQLELIKKIIM